MKVLIGFFVFVFLSGCEPRRNKPEQVTADYEVCLKAGMGAGLNSYSEIRCIP